MSVKISKTNSKLGVIPSINITPIVSCRPNCPCAKDCYAMKGRFRFHNARDNMAFNYESYKNNPSAYFDDICSAIDNGMISYSYFRWHAAGDIVDERYFDGMISVAKKLPRTSFLAFTKKYELVNSYIKYGGSIPSNLHIVFSAWGTSLPLENPYEFPVAHVRFKDPSENTSIPNSAVECSGDCSSCLQCWKIGRGESVVFNKH